MVRLTQHVIHGSLDCCASMWIAMWRTNEQLTFHAVPPSQWPPAALRPASGLFPGVGFAHCHPCHPVAHRPEAETGSEPLTNWSIRSRAKTWVAECPSLSTVKKEISEDSRSELIFQNIYFQTTSTFNIYLVYLAMRTFRFSCGSFSRHFKSCGYLTTEYHLHMWRNHQS